ncbi:MAG: hypothetical protein OEM66_05880 [Acidimicrobiia bacterium]|nr:hypothetical protein [Acidimicrobiia bacterium]
MFDSQDELIAALREEHRILVQLERSYSELVLLTEASEYRCLPKAIDDIAAVEAALGAAELMRAAACQQEGVGEATSDGLLAASPDEPLVGPLVTEMRRLYLDVSSHRDLAMRATDARLGDLAES